MKIRIELSSGKKISLTPAELNELYESLKEMKYKEETFYITNPVYPTYWSWPNYSTTTTSFNIDNDTISSAGLREALLD